ALGLVGQLAGFSGGLLVLIADVLEPVEITFDPTFDCRDAEDARPHELERRLEGLYQSIYEHGFRRILSFRLVEPISEHIDIAAGGARVLLHRHLVLGDELARDHIRPVAPAVDAVGARARADARV